MSLSGRILRHLTSTNVIGEVSPGQYTQTEFSKALLLAVFGEWINYLSVIMNRESLSETQR